PLAQVGLTGCASPGGGAGLFAGAAFVLLTFVDAGTYARAIAAPPEIHRIRRARADCQVRQPRGDLAGSARTARQHRNLDSEPAARRGDLSAVDRGRAAD